MTTDASNIHPPVDAEPAAVLKKVCTLDALALPARWLRVRTLMVTATSVAGVPDGVHITFARSERTRRRITAFVRLERTCCARFTYEVDDTANDVLQLTIRARGDDVSSVQTLYLHNRR